MIIEYCPRKEAIITYASKNETRKINILQDAETTLKRMA